MNNLPQLKLTLQAIAPSSLLTFERLEEWVQKVIQTLDPELETVQLTIRLTNAEEIQQLNQEFRQKNSPTNVLTFPYGIERDTLNADIVICMDVLEQEAVEQTKSLVDHATHLTIHGVLHAFGYDHITEEDALEMESLEVQILADMGIANPYILD